ncbi:hypothetical protein [Aequorivita sp. KMM 9714]|uniref:hypothetical protein n=1 Tax=Aequorivita sp. KMM 9714 TaxID=2707173 RepID=UPI0013ED4B39|nr:hypothetical protein [Aequorivita sp. KMM 9714]NGX85294.1 hypothetical protein [Aequorivita sp. KMM 9714]
MNSDELKTTDNHTTIKNWVEARDGVPAMTEGIANTSMAGKMLRINFHNNKENLSNISWDVFFEIFDENNFQLLYDDRTIDGKKSNYYQFVKKGDL